MSTADRDQRSTIDVGSKAHEALAHDEPREEAQKSYHTVLEQHVQQAQEDPLSLSRERYCPRCRFAYALPIAKQSGTVSSSAAAVHCVMLP